MGENIIKKTGSATPLILMIATSFIFIIYGLLFVLGIQMDNSNRQTASEKALNIAEAGINYYKWHLAHDPEDFKDGTDNDGPYIHEYKDPQGDTVGSYSLMVTPPQNGSTIVTIESTGWTKEYPKVKRTIKAQYGIPSLAEFSFVSNASTWYGAGITVNGKIHSNNGIRMDGTNTSLVTSAQETYMCGSETGCSPPTQKPGVWGSGGDSGLWQFPIPIIDFDSIAVNFDAMRTAAVDTGLYLDDSNASGYHLIFNSTGTVTINKVLSTSNIRGYSVPGQGLGALGLGGCRDTNQVINSETLVGTYNINETPIIFAEDDLWVEGTLRGRITVTAVRFPLTSSNAVIWIPNNITYTTYDGSDILGLVAQNNIYFAKNIPDYFQVDAILIAQKGNAMRHYYYQGCGGTQNAVRQKLTINGSLISYYKSYWNFGSAPDSGFRERVINFDNNSLYNPPPYFPTSGEYEFISWSEEKN
ncbi:MAG: hypothetical protein UT39_C0004G0008 [Candidatus Woesebacteria bacterium GW2011_GWA1_39_21]|uniref:DUF4900 domain-containing protein n=1 Tax=Candidatus Woesebacteria bacterium GW2011_GWA1_39_21 TaxID=1618550 RepID=A0A0G0N638_9BACT|nr:MAG: hypothetical protein UT39_C0004G0008 [Candidatus Woesebacteria bacterium GW2011_GWA1_39_21]